MQFIDVQNEFMAFIRDPSRPLPEGMTEKRMKVYSDLFFNNVHGFVSNGFPVLRTLYSEDDWNEIVRDFFINHDCHTPIFAEIAEEFLVFLQTEYQMKDRDPVFMLELAHYEWLELVVSIAQSQRSLQHLASESIQQLPLCLSDFARIAQYSYDVQHIDEDYQPTEPLEVPSFFCVYRDLEEQVKFLTLTPLTAQVLSYIQQAETTNFTELVNWLSEIYPQMSPESIEQGCLQLLGQMAEKDIVMTR
ncbi:DNA-binding domain-containing protein [Parashewanella tropica]|uniref:HvfC family RiPP maturation protein n=1 Tax=Parashewanella tropica TaxID=2547970 RepID=UPI00105A6206|nr:putative DNA-binding domain-containing protein [Parashewanella tropica]